MDNPTRFHSPESRRRGQALVEFTIALPILILLVAGILELGRGYAYGVAVSDAARDGARYAAGKAAATNGPGLANICSLVTADLVAVVPAPAAANITCPTLPGHAPPYVKGVDYPAPAAGKAIVIVYCRAAANCTGSPNLFYRSDAYVYVYYGFNDLNLFGGLLTISGSGQSKTSW